MFSFLLAIIYIAFISLGLPDALLGSAWPVMYEQFNVPISYAGIVSMIIAIGTIISSLMSDRLTRRMGAGLVTAISVSMTAVALFGFSFSTSFLSLCLWAIPYGLGAGSVDAALNNYVALNYAARHMSWLHCFWGVGASAGPYIMGYFLTRGSDWNSGYYTIGVIQVVLVFIIFLSLPLWKNTSNPADGEVESSPLTIRQALSIKGVKYVLLIFFGYCALESTAGLWASSFLVQHHGVGADTAARFASLFYLGITFGRFISGFVAEKLGDKKLIRYGILIIIVGIVLIGLPIRSSMLALIGLIIVGLGCAPVYPSIIHATPYNFGKENSQAIIGIQMASAYVGSTFVPPLFGVIAQYINIGLYPLYLLAFALLMLFMSERLKVVLNK